MFQAIAAIIMFLVGSSKIIQTILITISLIVGLTVIIIIAVISSLIKGNPQKEEEKTPKKEENTKIIYIVQNGTGNEIRIHDTEVDKKNQTPTVNREEANKPNIIQRTITAILRTIENIVRVVLISIGVILSTILLIMITIVVIDYLKRLL